MTAWMADGASDHERGLPTVVIDPGHGGNDSGAAGLYGTTEKQITLELAGMLAAELKKTCRVVLTREDDFSLAIPARTAVANRNRGELFISLHTGASFSRQPSGYSVYFYQPHTRYSLGSISDPSPPGPSSLGPVKWHTAQLKVQKDSQNLAGLICDRLKKTYPDVACGVFGAPLLVLEGSVGPAVLVESGFLTNPSDEKRMTSARERKAFVKAIGDAILAYLQTNPNQ